VNKIRFDLKPHSLFEPVEYTLSLSGKRLRPALTLIACNIWNDDVSDAVKPALGLEIFHNFTIMHDDLMDNADRRRNHPTVHRRWNNNAAILSGDAMVIAAYSYICATKEPYLKAVLALFTQTAMDICCGQQYDMDFETRNEVSEEEYIEMIRLKTAALISCCLTTGAIVGGAPKNDADTLYRFGHNIGLAFQLRDDLLDVYGDPSVFGKNTGGDILSDKKTFLRIKAMALCSEQQKNKVLRFNGSKEEKINAWTDLYDELNIKELTQKEINRYYENAMHELHSLTVSAEALTELIRFVNMLIDREV